MRLPCPPVAHTRTFHSAVRARLQALIIPPVSHRFPGALADRSTLMTKSAGKKQRSC